MKRFDLRHLGSEFLGRLVEIMETHVEENEVAIFMFEVGDFSGVTKSAEMIKEHNWTLMNSLRFNQVDWTLVIKKQAPVQNIESDVESTESTQGQDLQSTQDSTNI